jgi:hypothetical protein
MKIFGMISWVVTSALISALLNSWTMSVLWRWFAAAEYGHGPSTGAWFGIGTIAYVAVGTYPTKKKGERSDGLEWMVGQQFMRWSLILMTLGLSWIIGASVGWIR